LSVPSFGKICPPAAPNRDSSSTDVAARAGANLGVVLCELGRPQEALAAHQQIIDDYRDDPRKFRC
jgi:hypothetical protein